MIAMSLMFLAVVCKSRTSLKIRIILMKAIETLTPEVQLMR